MRCVNCAISCRHLRRHVITSLLPEMRAKLTQWLPFEMSMDEVICHPCYILLSSEETLRVLGHTMVCLGCAKSLRSQRNHLIQDNSPLLQLFPTDLVNRLQGITSYRLCQSCWQIYNRRFTQDQTRDIMDVARPDIDLPQHPPPPPPPLQPPQLQLEPPPVLRVSVPLPNYKRAANTGNHCVFERCNNRTRHLVPQFIKKILLSDNNFYIPRSARVCEIHLNSNEWDSLLLNNNTMNTFTPMQIEDMLSLKSYDSNINFDKVLEMPNHICHYWTSLTVNEFISLYNSLAPIIVKRPKMALALYLSKLRTGESDRRLSTVFNISKTTLNRLLKVVRVHVSQHLVPHHLGPEHINHTEIVERNLSLPNALFGNAEAPIDERWAVASFDGTYVYLQKSSNYLFQKNTYSLHKYDNLVKPFMIVSGDGHIIDVVGPYKATQTDAEIITDLFGNENSPYRQLFKERDVFILDRGFRDAIPLLRGLNYQIQKPESCLPGQQYTTQQANRSRRVTLCRWVVEVVNGRFKRDFKLFRQRFFNLAAGHLMMDFRNAAALINIFHPVIEDSPNCNAIIERVERYFNEPNNLGDLVNEHNLNRRTVMFNRIDGNLPLLESFPRLTYNDLLLFSLGPYQVQQARSYFGEHVRRNGMYEIEVCPQPETTLDIRTFGGNRPCLIRGRIKSRHTSQKIYYTYLIFDEEPTNPNTIDNILGHYCNCKVGSRTVGCFCHVMTNIWYLGWARHQGNVKPPASFLDSICIRLNEYI